MCNLQILFLENCVTWYLITSVASWWCCCTYNWENVQQIIHFLKIFYFWFQLSNFCLVISLGISVDFTHKARMSESIVLNYMTHLSILKVFYIILPQIISFLWFFLVKRTCFDKWHLFKVTIYAYIARSSMRRHIN